MPKSAGRLTLLITLVVAAVAMAACAAQASPPVASPTPSSTPAGPLVIVETRGGECPDGACDSTIVIEADGRVHDAAPADSVLGTVPTVVLEGLTTEIAKADFTALKSHPFTGTCPVAFDGQETIYTFATASGLERIASCEVEVDPSDPLYVAVSAALGVVGR